jgi:hypothetical protein
MQNAAILILLLQMVFQVGLASDDKMLSLLDSALQSDTVTTVRQARELIDSGVDPLSLMSRLAASVTDILGGSFTFTEKLRKGFFRKQPRKGFSCSFFFLFRAHSCLHDRAFHVILRLYGHLCGMKSCVG